MADKVLSLPEVAAHPLVAPISLETIRKMSQDGRLWQAFGRPGFTRRGQRGVRARMITPESVGVLRGLFGASQDPVSGKFVGWKGRQ